MILRFIWSWTTTPSTRPQPCNAGWPDTRIGTFHFTPTGASWLNRVEVFFALLTEQQLRWGVHRSTQELEQTILHYIDTVSADPRPLLWIKCAEDILATIKRFCLRTLDTAYSQRNSARL